MTISNNFPSLQIAYVNLASILVRGDFFDVFFFPFFDVFYFAETNVGMGEYLGM